MWSLHYCLLVFIAVVGVLQLASVYNNLRGLLFFPRKGYSLAFAVIAIGLALVAFFTWNDYHRVIVEGSQQTGSFVLSAAAAMVFTLVVSSVLNHRRLDCGKVPDGLDTLRKHTFFQAIRSLWGGEGDDG
jgi:hypothetical protein